MQPSDKPKFLAVLNGLAAVKPGAKLTAEGLDVWWHSFREWEIEEFSSAAAHLAKSCEFMPNPFHFEQLRKASRLTAGEAWAEAREIIRSGGDCHGDPAIDAAVRALGGYRQLGFTHSDQMHFLERRFAEHYERISEAEEVREALPRLSMTHRLPYDPNKFLE